MALVSQPMHLMRLTWCFPESGHPAMKVVRASPLPLRLRSLITESWWPRGFIHAFGTAFLGTTESKQSQPCWPRS